MKRSRAPAYRWALAAGLITPFGWQVLDDAPFFQEASTASSLRWWCAVMVLLCVVLARVFRDRNLPGSSVPLFFKLLASSFGAGLLATLVFFVTHFEKIGG